jgi:hypothetical protein
MERPKANFFQIVSNLLIIVSFRYTRWMVEEFEFDSRQRKEVLFSAVYCPGRLWDQSNLLYKG